MSRNDDNKRLKSLYDESYSSLCTHKLKYSTINYRRLIEVNEIIEKIVNEMQEKRDKRKNY